MQNQVLFSGSRDTCIKRWDLNRKEMVVSINNAHGGWITGLAFAPKNDSVFLSSGRDGIVKIWSVDSCRELGKVDAHKGAVNCLATNSSLIFTGSQEGLVHIWKLRKSMDAPSSPDSSDTSP
jgi:kinesin family protein 4/21/27